MRILCLVVDRVASRHPLAETVTTAVASGVDWVQIRKRDLDGAALCDWAAEIAAAARRGAEARAGVVAIIVNRRIDVALAIGADGVHLGFDAVGPADARALLPTGAAIGVSAHHPDEVLRARRAGATYAQLAPIWDPLSKPAERPALGASELTTACTHALPVLAQGGVTAARCAVVLACGARGVAVTGDILLAEDPGRAAAALRAALDV